MGTLNLYAAGGAGINLVSGFIKHSGRQEHGFANITPFFLDTSRSNLRNLAVDDEHVYLVEGVDGSGKKRDSNYHAISERSKEMLHRFKPADINVVVHSASGGTGSVIGPVLVSELLSRDVPTIVVMVGGSDSRIEAVNTVNTLKSYEVISQKREVPVVSVYYENTKENPRGKVDSRVQTTIVLLAAIFSGQNRELDSEDMVNFLDYTKVTTHHPRLTCLDFFSKKIEVDRNQAVVGVITLTDDKTDSSSNVPVEYQAVGFVDDKIKEAVGIELPIHAATIAGYFNNVIANLETRIKEIDDIKNASIQKPIISANQKSEDDGLVL